MIDAPTLPTISTRPGQIASLADLAAIPEEEVWLASQKSARTRRAYRLDVAHFMRCLGITTPEQLRQVDHRAVIAWERMMREDEGALPSTVRRRLAALSSLFKHLVRHGAASRNPVADVTRPAINREEGSTRGFLKAQARDCWTHRRATRWRACGTAPSSRWASRWGYGGRRSPRCGWSDLHQNRGLDALRLTRKGGRRDALAINPQAATAHPGVSGARWAWAATMAGRCSGRCAATPRRTIRPARLDPDAIDRMVRKYAAAIGLPRGYSAHSMRATFITTALENGAQLEDVQKAAGHRDPSTTKLYDRRGYNPEKAASFFATY